MKKLIFVLICMVSFLSAGQLMASNDLKADSSISLQKSNTECPIVNQVVESFQESDFVVVADSSNTDKEKEKEKESQDKEVCENCGGTGVDGNKPCSKCG